MSVCFCVGVFVRLGGSWWVSIYRVCGAVRVFACVCVCLHVCVSVSLFGVLFTAHG